MTESVRHGKWEVIDFIDQGGQGAVYRVRDQSRSPDNGERRRTLYSAIATCSAIATDLDREKAALQIADEVRRIVSEPEAPMGALKKLLPIEEAAAEDEATALAGCGKRRLRPGLADALRGETDGGVEDVRSSAWAVLAPSRA